MRKVIATILIVLGIAVIVAGISLAAFPEWLSIPGGILLLLIAAFAGVADLGGKLKDWRDLIFGGKKKDDPVPVIPQTQTGESPSVEIRGNFMWGKNKIGVNQEKVRVVENPMLGNNEIEVGRKAGRKPKSKK
jgi:hypothetical protein